MSWILVTNDDGIDSPALGPFASALRALGEIRVVVPESERSWIGKAITRYDEIETREDDRFDVPAVTVSGYPADAVQVGAVYFGEEPPSMVVSGINIGYNHGAGFIVSSGTIGAAIEGWELGLPAYSFSAGTDKDWNTWAAFARSPASRPHWERLAELSAQLLADTIPVELGGDVVNVNVPWEADATTPVRVTTIARVAYGQVHRGDGDGRFRHGSQLADFAAQASLAGTDVGANYAGEIAITPMLMPTAPVVSPEARAQLERG